MNGAPLPLFWRWRSLIRAVVVALCTPTVAVTIARGLAVLFTARLLGIPARTLAWIGLIDGAVYLIGALWIARRMRAEAPRRSTQRPRS